MRRYFKVIMILASVAVTIMSILPVMSIYLSGGESCTLYVRGFNLMEFSAWGCIPLFAPLLIPVILFGHQSKAAQEAELMLLFGVNMVSYVHSFNAARAWLELEDALITYYPGMLLIPFAFILALIIGVVFDCISRNA